MEKHFYHDNYNGLSEWVCENLRVPLEFRPVFLLLNLLVVAYVGTRIDNEWGRFCIIFFYLFNPYFIDRMRKERFDDTDKYTMQTPIISKQTQTYDTEGSISYGYEIYLNHPNDAQFFCIKVDSQTYDKLLVGDELEVHYSTQYTRQLDVFINK